MMPVAPVVPLPTRPKIGFSIDSIVGEDCEKRVSRARDTNEPNDVPKNRASGLDLSQTSKERDDSSPLSVNMHWNPERKSPTLSSPSPPFCHPNPLTNPGFSYPLFQHGPHPSLVSPFQPPTASLPGLPGYIPRGHPFQPHLHGGEHPLIPWLLSRQGRIFSHPYAVPEGFLVHPCRKQKRIRTAFSPTQLLQLEKAFERNHYVVGAERKQLAQKLNLTETQVKVWFQNRRTKHKRVQQEDESPGSQATKPTSDKSSEANNSSSTDDEMPPSDC